MKPLSVLLLALLCMTVLITGQLYWSNKIEQASTLEASLTKAPSTKGRPSIINDPHVFNYEPLHLNSNGIASTSEMIDEVLEKLEAENEYMYTILTPLNPIYGAIYYPREVEDLKEYAEKHTITYVDHWTAWPDYQNEEIIEYLNEEQSAPNEKGVEIWVDEIIWTINRDGISVQLAGIPFYVLQINRNHPIKQTR